MKRIFVIALCCAAMTALVCSCGNNKKKAAEEAEAAAMAELEAAEAAEEAEKAEIALNEKLASLPEEPVFDMVTNFGTIRIKLYSGTPKHRDNFAKLALSGFYDGILFHRVINGFMIQGGDPLSKDPAQKDKWGTGGPGYNVPAEILPEYTHKKGALAAARRGDAANPLRESSGSQFYLVQDAAACAQLDGAYTVYGETISGFDVIDNIARVQKDQRDRPLETVKIISVKFVPAE